MPLRVLQDAHHLHMRTALGRGGGARGSNVGPAHPVQGGDGVVCPPGAAITSAKAAAHGGGETDPAGDRGPI